MTAKVGLEPRLEVVQRGQAFVVRGVPAVRRPVGLEVVLEVGQLVLDDLEVASEPPLPAVVAPVARDQPGTDPAERNDQDNEDNLPHHGAISCPPRPVAFLPPRACARAR